ncbi:S41 family peptidase [Chryseobacterium vrystaatense]|uniref:Peptidase family S41 n=1 Tax=Chryseobacterium vrystaatense TaxID=307480 RepID=A0A1M5NPC7_9FLAO|nr:S41 family peptidase [Chryseobacterium vrystaatense]SHG91382.1 Peptidase family S41 [Chryseobacterium vrystaatense]
MKRFYFLITFFVIFIHTNANAQTDSVQSYVVRAIDLMKAKSVNKHRINWDSLYTDSHKKAAKLHTIRETYPLIKNILGALKDAHSNFFPPEMVKDYTLGYRATGQEFPVIEAKITENGMAYISLPGFACYHFAEWDEFVNTFYKKIEELNAQKPKGWILDLRENGGGMFYPMLAALSPMLDKQNAIGTVDAEGQYAFFEFDRDGNLFEGKQKVHHFNIKKVPQRITKPIIVMVSKKTSSSGEFSTIAFAGQKNVRIIGQNTMGLTSGNQEYKLSDGAFLVLTTGNIVDRNKKEYDEVGKGFSPQVQLKDLSDAEYMKTANDLLLKK